MIKAHDIGLQLVERDGVLGARVIVGGGLGRTPMIGKELSEFVAFDDLLAYLEATVSVWNQIGRRDNKYKARIKITVHEHGIDAIRAKVNERFLQVRPQFKGADMNLLEEIKGHFAAPAFREGSVASFESAYTNDPVFRSWVDTNIAPHKNADHAIVTISIKKHGQTPGDATAEQMRVMADLAEEFAYDELRISHEQNVILPHVHKSDLPAIHAKLKEHELATANIGLISDIIACPGMDYCALATARSIPVAQEIATRFDDLKLEHDIGHLKIKISGCINACGHHHVGHIGILGLDRAGVENYQITLGGDGTETAAIGDRTGPGFAYDEIVPAVERIVDTIWNNVQAPRRPSWKPIVASAWPRSRRPSTPRRRPMPLDLIQTELGQRPRELTEKVEALNARFRHHSAHDVMHGAIEEIEKLALVSSFGAESVVLLHMAAVVDKMTPVLFVDTQMLFTETLEYQQEVSERLGLKNVQIIRADDEDVQREDPYGALRLRDMDACCNLRKTFPLQRALAGYCGWITGRKRFQSGHPRRARVL